MALGCSLTDDLAFAQSLNPSGWRVFFSRKSAVSVIACERWKNLIDRTHRVSTTPFSWFSFGIWTWLMLFLLILILALTGNTTMKILLAIRYGIGVSLYASVFIKSRRFSLIPMAFIFEILAVGIGILVLIKHAMRQKILWGGIYYGR